MCFKLLWKTAKASISIWKAFTTIVTCSEELQWWWESLKMFSISLFLEMCDSYAKDKLAQWDTLFLRFYSFEMNNLEIIQAGNRDD